MVGKYGYCLTVKKDQKSYIKGKCLIYLEPWLGESANIQETRQNLKKKDFIEIGIYEGERKIKIGEDWQRVKIYRIKITRLLKVFGKGYEGIIKDILRNLTQEEKIGLQIGCQRQYKKKVLEKIESMAIIFPVVILN